MNALIFDQTGSANTAFDTGKLSVGNYDAILCVLLPVGGVFTAVNNNFYVYDAAGNAIVVRSSLLTVSGTVATAVWALGTGANSAVNGGAVVNAPLPKFIKYEAAALGAGVSARILVYAKSTSRESI